MRFNKIIVDVICYLMLVLFVYSALAKLFDYDAFVAQIGKSPLIAPFAGLISWGIPLLEISISVMLLVPGLRMFALLSSFTLMTLFTFYIVAILNFGGKIPCSCGGVLEKLGWNEHLIFNSVFVFFAFIGSVFEYKMRMVSRLTEKNV